MQLKIDRLIELPWTQSTTPMLKHLIEIGEYTIKIIYPDIAKTIVNLSLWFTDDNTIMERNKTFRNLNKPTNTLSFPAHQNINNAIYDQETVMMLGDIMFAHGVIYREAKEQLKKTKNHIYHLFVHSLLHCLGLDHNNIDSRCEMESIEIDIMKQFHINNPYLI